LFVLAQSRDRRAKENAMRRRKLKALIKGLNRLRSQMTPKPRRRKLSRDQVLRRVAVLKKEAGRIASFIAVREPEPGEEVSRQTFTYTFDHERWRGSVERDGSYILRAWLPDDGWPAGMENQAQVLQCRPRPEKPACRPRQALSDDQSAKDGLAMTSSRESPRAGGMVECAAFLDIAQMKRFSPKHDCRSDCQQKNVHNKDSERIGRGRCTLLHHTENDCCGHDRRPQDRRDEK
jgi:hypothetical protein